MGRMATPAHESEHADLPILSLVPSQSEVSCVARLARSTKGVSLCARATPRMVCHRACTRDTVVPVASPRKRVSSIRPILVVTTVPAMGSGFRPHGWSFHVFNKMCGDDMAALP